ncbi:TPA: DUF4153 domain-containing protein [Pasteurella multocida]|nr:DUF4153 domain-containing protein [Pasteurella multocida]
MNIIQSFTHRLSDLIKQYPLAMSFIFISTAFIPWIQDESISRDMIVVLLLPIYFSAALLLTKYKYANGLAIAYAILITLAFYFADRPIYDNDAYWGLLLIHFVLFVTYPLAKENRLFVYNTVSRLTQLALAIVLAGIICICAVLVLNSIEYLFNINLLSHRIVPKTLLFIMCFFTPVFFLIFEQRLAQNFQGERFHYVIELIINFIFSPVVILYTLIVYLYLAKILFYFELPKGGVVYIIMPYIALGLCCQGLRLLLIDAKWTGFYRVFAYLSIAPLVLLWVGIHTRITTYGLTEIRVMLVVLASMMTLFILFSMTQRLQQYRLFSLTACLLLFISTILTSPYYLAQQHQLARFERLLSELNILDEQQQISATIFDSQFAKQLSSEQVEKYKQLDEIIGVYIKTNPAAVAKYGQEKLNYLHGFYYNQIIYNTPYQDEEASITFYAYDTRRNGKYVIDIAPYQTLHLVNGYINNGDPNDLEAQDKSILFQRQFDLIDEDTGNKYGFDEHYFVEVFKAAGLDIHQKYSQDTLLPLAKQLTQVPTREGGLLIFRDMDFKYEVHGDIKGYVYQGGYVEFYLAP